MDEPRLARQMAFLLECDRSKQVNRQTYLADGSRKENDAEHAWHLGLMALLLAEYANEPVDLCRTMAMALVHDLVEIDAGDTYAYDAAANADKAQREEAAAQRLFSMLPEDQQALLQGLWEEFEAGLTPEARFAAALDKLQPLMLNAASQGKSWLEHHVPLQAVLRRNENTPQGSQALWAYAKKQYIDPAVQKGLLY